MKKWIAAGMAAALLGTTAPAMAGDRCVTVDGYFIAATEPLLDQVVRFSTHRDTEAIMRLVNAGRVIMVKGGVPVHIEGARLGKLKIRLPGATIPVWTVQEAVSCD